MQKQDLTGFYINPEKHIACEKTIKDTLPDFYKLLDCELIDIVRRKIGGVYYDVVCDDEGLFKNPCFPSALTDDGQVALVGSLFICFGNDNTGELESLSDYHIASIFNKVVLYDNPRGDGFCSAVLLD